MSALSVINVRMAFWNSYFELSSDTRVFLHFWSLAVEEQFYLLFPGVLYLLHRRGKWRIRVIASLFLASVAACLLLSWTYPKFAFYLLPTRAWELLAGALLALLRHSGWRPTLRQATGMGWAGLAVMLLSFAVIGPATVFPGWIASLPVAGTVLMLASVGLPDLRLAKVLSHPAATFVGKRSYALYLWHWPVFALTDYAMVLSDGATRGAVKAGLTTLATLASYRLIERPARRLLNMRRHRGIAFAAFAAAVLSVAAAGYWARTGSVIEVSRASLGAGGVIINPGRPKAIALLGDSLAASHGQALADIARRHDATLYVFAMTGTNQLPHEAGTLWPQINGFLATARPDALVVAESWTSKSGRDADGLRRAVRELSASGGHLILLNQPPSLPPEATREAVRRDGLRPVFEPAKSRDAPAHMWLAGLRSKRVTVIDVKQQFLRPDGTIRLFDDRGRYLFFDRGHLSSVGIERVIPLLDAAVAKVLAEGAR